MVISDSDRIDRSGPAISVDRDKPVRQMKSEATSEFFPSFPTVRAVLEAAQIGLWCWDSAADTVTWSSNLEALYGMPPHSFDGSYAGFVAHIHADDRTQVETALQQALRARAPFRARYRALRHDGRDSGWLEAAGTVLDDGATAKSMIGLCYDATERVNLEAELRARVRQQEALAQLGERALAAPDLERLLNDAVSTVAVTLSVDFVSILELLPSGSELLLRAGFGWKSDLVGTVLATTEPNSLARLTLDSAIPVVIADFASESRFAIDSYLHDHCCTSGVSLTIAGRDGRAFGLLGICTTRARQFGVQDIAFLAAVGNILAGAIQRRQLEQRHELMIRDMRHRTGNLFSQLLALFSQTARTSKNIAELGSKYQARVLALANAHRLVTEGGWRSIPIMDLLAVVLGPYIDQASLDGPNIDLEPDPVFNLSAALHELAANAVKHGSLSRAKGRLDLHWSVERGRRGITLLLDWTETNGPPARRPRRLGFGSRLIDLVIKRQLNGEVTRSYSRKGLVVKLQVPLTRERWPAPAPVAAGVAHPV